MFMKLFFAIFLAGSISACVSDGVRFYRPDLNDDIVLSIKTGDTESAVVAKLGEPYRRIRFDNLRETAMDYRYRDTWGYWVDHSIMIGDDGLVRGRFSARIEVGRDRYSSLNH